LRSSSLNPGLTSGIRYSQQIPIFFGHFADEVSRDVGVARKKTPACKRFRFFSREFPLVLIPPRKKKNKANRKKARTPRIEVREGSDGIGGTGSLSLGAPTPMEAPGNCVTVATNVSHAFCILERVHPLSPRYRHPRMDIADSNWPCVPS